ncbi:MAG: Protoporphyrinogen oxidase-like protein [Candidatus Gottesmanbacteria bacterium GW2011_GWC2_39_8]|uniref:Protoporphyrinogen oxidase-like protein n=1 Tax=Candidatus Gottesmanbacteria bacterium GW2011_GWC2_39_8 TaxID=1618450 RepID=A0A0G0PYN2_9BACT|nr:MAG: Protoporphyrinogen oxidase-like protein [Candidatus Gottesmanbacteria bacterium GW2011_GWC2_39_8]
MEEKTCILGSGMTGLAAGFTSGLPIYEAEEFPGGICSSYFIRPGTRKRLQIVPEDGDAYRFEIGGGHWIFGVDPAILRFIRSHIPLKCYKRKSGIYFFNQNLYVPYPLQNHLSYFNEEIRINSLSEIVAKTKGNSKTMANAMENNFGQTLTELFFGPFHELYTGGLWKDIASQDSYKSPLDLSLILRGAFGGTPQVGYNAVFVYPEEGLNVLAQRLAAQCKINYGKKVVQIDVSRKEVFFADGSGIRYETLISTFPLNRMLEMTRLEIDEKPAPYSSVLVLNIGAIKGSDCPDHHWLYVPDSKAGFHRIGFYNNVDVSFLPKSYQSEGTHVSLYIEKSYRGGCKPTEQEIKVYASAVVNELLSCKFIKDVEVLDTTWIDIAYTWSYPDSGWKVKALELLKENNIIMIGRYGRWEFQGILDSIKEGLLEGIVSTRNKKASIPV